MPIRHDPPARQLHLWVQPLAVQHGFRSVPQLALQLEAKRQSLYGQWRDQTSSISLGRYGEYARLFRARLGDWFAWAGAPYESEVVWQVRRLREQGGLSVEDLHFRAQVYMSSLAPIDAGTAQAVHFNTLARLALTLEQVLQRPFDTGDLLRWERPPLDASTVRAWQLREQAPATAV